MPYGLAAVVLSLVLGPIYILLTDAGPVSKAVVGVLLTAAVVISWQFPAWALAATLIQCGVCIYIILYLKVH